MKMHELNSPFALYLCLRSHQPPVVAFELQASIENKMSCPIHAFSSCDWYNFCALDEEEEDARDVVICNPLRW